MVIGHRGARGLYPENTLEAVRAMLARGLRRIEVDVGVTADGVAVLHHDPAINPDLARGPDGRWIAAPGPLLRTRRFAELQAYDVGRIRPGSAYAAAFADQTPIDGARIRALSDLLRLDAGLQVTIEMKLLADQPEATVPPDVMAAATLAAIGAEGAARRVTVSCFDWRGLAAIRRLNPDVKLACLTEAATVAAARRWWDGRAAADHGGSVPRTVTAVGATTWSPEHVDLTPALVAEAQDLGLAVVPWTVNDPADMARLLAWGVDGLITDRPDLVPGRPT